MRRRGDHGKRLVNLPALREVGAQANRRLLDVQRISHDPILGEATFDRLTQPAVVEGQRASALRFADQRTQTLLAALVIFRLGPAGFAARDLRGYLAPLLGLAPDELRQGRLTYELRRLRLHGLIERIRRSHRYRVTELGFRTACFFTRSYARSSGLRSLSWSTPASPSITVCVIPCGSSNWPSIAGRWAPNSPRET